MMKLFKDENNNRIELDEIASYRKIKESFSNGMIIRLKKSKHIIELHYEDRNDYINDITFLDNHFDIEAG